MAIANITNNILTDSGVATSSLQPTISLTTTGTSGAATFSANTLNIPNYGSALTSYVPYTGATGDVTLGNFSITGNVSTFKNSYIDGSASTNGQLMIKQALLGSTNYAGYTSFYSTGTNISLLSDAGSSNYKSAILSLSSLTNNTARTYTLPDASGTLALTSALSGYLPLTGGTLTGALNGTSAMFSSTMVATQGFFDGVATNGLPTSKGTAQNYIRFKNTGGDFYIGQESSVAGSFFTGSSAYASVFYGTTAQEFIIGGVRRMTIKATGVINMSNVPTSSAGLSTGDIYSTAGALMIV